MRKVCILRMQKASVHIISTYSFATCSQNPTHHIDQNLSAQGWCIFGETGTSMTWALYSISFPHLAEAEASIFHLPIVPKCSRPSPTTVCSTKSHGISTSEHSLLSRCFCLNHVPRALCSHMHPTCQAKETFVMNTPVSRGEKSLVQKHLLWHSVSGKPCMRMYSSVFRNEQNWYL